MTHWNWIGDRGNAGSNLRFLCTVVQIGDREKLVVAVHGSFELTRLLTLYYPF